MTTLTRRGHSHRLYSPEEFIEEYRNADSVKARGEIRNHFRGLDSGRFPEMLDEMHRVMSHLDNEGRKHFAENTGDWLLRWVATFGVIEELNTFEEYTGISG